MTYDGIASRGRRLSCLFILLAGVIMPTILKLFLMTDTWRSSHQWEDRRISLKAIDFFLSDYAQSVDDEVDERSILSKNSILTTKEFQRMKYDYVNRINADHSELSRLLNSEHIYHRIDQKRSIHAIVTTVIAFVVPLIAFTYAIIFPKQPERSTRKRKGRKQRIAQGLEKCRIQIPPNSGTEDTTSTGDEEQQECPICLSAFTPGEVVIASKFCRCNVYNRPPRGTDKSTSVDDDSIKPQHRRTFFHEKCICTWLSQRKANPKKLCPCCRQPFLASK